MEKGVKTSEFYVMIATGIVGLLMAFGVFTSEQGTQAMPYFETIQQVIGALILLIGGGTYTAGRIKLKRDAVHQSSNITMGVKTGDGKVGNDIAAAIMIIELIIKYLPIILAMFDKDNSEGDRTSLTELKAACMAVTPSDTLVAVSSQAFERAIGLAQSIRKS